jgi:hypothetical protein
MGWFGRGIERKGAPSERKQIGGARREEVAREGFAILRSFFFSSSNPNFNSTSNLKFKAHNKLKIMQ